MYTYSELMTLETYAERLEYLKEAAQINTTPTEYISAKAISNPFYKGKLWRRCARDIKKRDLGRDLNVEGMDIEKTMGVHHINPLTAFDIETLSYKCFDPENLVTVEIETTHNHIHYSSPIDQNAERVKGDTTLW